MHALGRSHHPSVAVLLFARVGALVRAGTDVLGVPRVGAQRVIPRQQRHRAVEALRLHRAPERVVALLPVLGRARRGQIEALGRWVVRPRQVFSTLRSLPVVVGEALDDPPESVVRRVRFRQRRDRSAQSIDDA